MNSFLIWIQGCGWSRQNTLVTSLIVLTIKFSEFQIISIMSRFYVPSIIPRRFNNVNERDTLTKTMEYCLSVWLSVSGTRNHAIACPGYRSYCFLLIWSLPMFPINFYRHIDKSCTTNHQRPRTYFPYAFAHTITSTWIQSAPHCIIFEVSSARCAKSAAKMDGAIFAGGISVRGFLRAATRESELGFWLPLRMVATSIWLLLWMYNYADFSAMNHADRFEVNCRNCSQMYHSDCYVWYHFKCSFWKYSDRSLLSYSESSALNFSHCSVLTWCDCSVMKCSNCHALNYPDGSALNYSDCSLSVLLWFLLYHCECFVLYYSNWFALNTCDCFVLTYYDCCAFYHSDICVQLFGMLCVVWFYLLCFGPPRELSVVSLKLLFVVIVRTICTMLFWLLNVELFWLTQVVLVWILGAAPL